MKEQTKNTNVINSSAQQSNAEVFDNYRAIGVTLQYRPISSISLHTGHIKVKYFLMVLPICNIYVMYFWEAYIYVTFRSIFVYRIVFMLNLGSSTMRRYRCCLNVAQSSRGQENICTNIVYISILV